MFHWKDSPSGQYLKGQDFTISYITDGLLSESKDETALIDERDGGRTYYILNGDWRKGYSTAARNGGYDACKLFYDSMKAEFRSRWSEDDSTDVTNEEARIIVQEYLKTRLA
jgi:hypothetical protein